MTADEKMLTPDWLFERAGVTAGGVTLWRLLVPERGAGVYVVTSTKTPADRTHVVYIGRTKHLRTRLNQFYRHQYGRRSPHRGGQEILTLPGQLTVHWAAVAEYATAERIMLDAFRGIAGVWPFGNRMKSAALASTSN